jgi:hypothetical protein
MNYVFKIILLIHYYCIWFYTVLPLFNKSILDRLLILLNVVKNYVKSCLL